MENKETKFVSLFTSMCKIKHLSKEDTVSKFKELGYNISVHTFRNYEAGKTDIRLKLFDYCQFYNITLINLKEPHSML